MGACIISVTPGGRLAGESLVESDTGDSVAALDALGTYEYRVYSLLA